MESWMPQTNTLELCLKRFLACGLAQGISGGTLGLVTRPVNLKVGLSLYISKSLYICILERRSQAHLLVAAIKCFEKNTVY